MNQVTFTSSASLAAPDNAACSKCGGTKPTCCRCPEDSAPTANRFVQEFTTAAIEAHVGYQHGAKWHECEYAKCVERREMIEALYAAAHGSPSPAEGQKCVKCGHDKNDPRRRGSDGFDSFCILGCGCKCVFPTRVQPDDPGE